MKNAQFIMMRVMLRRESHSLKESPCAQFHFALCSTQSLRVERRSQTALPAQQRLCMPLAASNRRDFLLAPRRARPQPLQVTYSI